MMARTAAAGAPRPQAAPSLRPVSADDAGSCVPARSASLRLQAFGPGPAVERAIPDRGEAD